MNTPIEIARKLIVECSKECPCLAEVQRLCETTFEEIERPSLKIRSVCSDTDALSQNSSKATFIAYHWAKDNFKINCPKDSGDNPTYFNDEESSDRFFLTRALENLHSLQIYSDPRFLNHLKNCAT